MLEVCPQGRVAINGLKGQEDSNNDGKPAVGSRSSWENEEEGIEVLILSIFPF